MGAPPGGSGAAGPATIASPPAAAAPEDARHRPGVESHLTALAVTFVEMQQGLRPVNTLDGVASPAARRRIRALTAVRRPRRTGPVRRTAPVLVLRVHTMRPSAGVVEGSVVFECDSRVRALALRLEYWETGWTLVEIAPPEGGLNAVITAASGRIVTRAPVLPVTPGHGSA